ncbi:MAG TPA: dienelactone hydrolase family protein [Ramlibacter sp.]|nr:dienelactone hydrolase family protein [Ramlibacter sp.]
MANDKVKTRWIDMQGGDKRFQGYLALPPAGKGPGIVVFQEIFGVNSHIRGVVEQYALDGFVVLAPDVFWRQAQKVELGYEGADRDRGVEMMKKLTAEELLADIRNTVATLRALPEVTGKVGAVGYCLGGRLAYLACANTDIDAASAWYGGGIQDLLDQAPRIKAPLQFHYAENDHAIPLTAVDKVRGAMTGKAEVFIYPGAQHGFNCWERASYDPRSAALAHGRTLSFFAEKLYA